jgi:hypothetical protein
MSKGFNCECGKHHEFTVWVFAHPKEILVHTCDQCGRRHQILQFEVIGVFNPKKGKKS